MIKKNSAKLISFQQTVCVKNRFIGEEGIVISYILREILNLKDFFIVTVDTEKVFDSLNHSFFTCLS